MGMWILVSFREVLDGINICKLRKQVSLVSFVARRKIHAKRKKKHSCEVI